MRLASTLLFLLVLARGAAAQVVDSLLPPAEEIRRFQATLASRPVQFEAGAPSRDRLVRQFVTALEAGDSTGLARLLLTREEFGTLYYPSSEYARPPYFQKPGLVWFRLATVSSKGLGRLVTRDGRRALGFRRYHCSATPLRQGRNTIWKDCLVEVAAGDSIRTRRIFGSIIGRGGRFKFLSYATEY